MSELVDQVSRKPYLEDNTVPEDILAHITGAAGSNNNAGSSLALGAFIGGGVGLKVGGLRDGYNTWKGAGSDVSKGEKIAAAAMAGAKSGAKFGVIGAAVGTTGMLVNNTITHQQVKG
jgi:hypothetical protein